MRTRVIATGLAISIVGWAGMIINSVINGKQSFPAANLHTLLFVIAIAGGISCLFAPKQ